MSALAIDAVIEIPPRTLSDLVGIPSAIIVVRRGKPRESGVFMGTYQPDQGAAVVKALREGVGEFFVASGELKDRWTRSFHDPRQKAMRGELDRLGARPLGDFGEIRLGSNATLDRHRYKERGEYLVLTGRHLRQTAIVASKSDRFVDETDDKWLEKFVVEPGDVVFSLLPPSAYVYKTTDPPSIAGNNVAVLRTHDNEYVSTFMNTPEGKRLFERQAHSIGSSLAGHVRVSVADLREIRIPVLPLEELNAVSDAAIAVASLDELQALRQELERVQHELELARAELKRKPQADQGQVLTTLQFVVHQNAKILEQQEVASAKLDHLVAVVGTVLVDIGDIKKGGRSDEEKLVRICQKLDTLTEGATDEVRTIQEYVAVVQTWLDRWGLLDGLTQRFLPSAEQLYDLLGKQEGADFSPFIIQYCRALENEILMKLFCAYHDEIRKRIPDLKSFVAPDLSIEQTARFAKSVRDDKRKYTLGEMDFTMQLIKPGGKTLKSSPLLQDFRGFVTSYFSERIAEKEFLERLKRINEDFRCKAAHPYLMTKEEADRCLLAIREALCELPDAYRTDKALGGPLGSRSEAS